MANFFTFILLIVFSIILLIPFGIALLYIGMGFWQLVTGNKENSRFKQRGGLKALLIASCAFVCIVLFWIWFYRQI